MSIFTLTSVNNMAMAAGCCSTVGLAMPLAVAVVMRRRSRTPFEAPRLVKNEGENAGQSFDDGSGSGTVRYEGGSFSRYR